MVGFVLTLALVSFLTNEYAARRGESDRQNLAIAVSQLNAANVRARAADARAKIESARGDSAEARAANYSVAAKKSAASASVAWARFEAAAASNVCDSPCIDAARSSHLSDSVALAATSAALLSESTAAARYKLGLDQAVASLTELRNASAGVITAAKPLTKSPSRLRALIPAVGVGAAAGLDLHGAPNVVTGITFGWKF